MVKQQRECFIGFNEAAENTIYTIINAFQVISELNFTKDFSDIPQYITKRMQKSVTYKK